jgi:hypothetical protein
MIAEGRIKREVAEQLLESVAKTSGLWREDADQVSATIRSGIETGIKQWHAMVGKATMQGAHVDMQPLSGGAETTMKTNT